MISLKRNTALILTAGVIATQIAAVTPAFSAKGFWDQKKALAQRGMPEIQTSLIRLKKSDNLWTVLEDSEVKSLMKKVMGSDTEKYFNMTQLAEMPEVKGNDLYSAGNVRGMFTICETFFNLNLTTKKLCICVLDDNKLSIYGAQSHEDLPEPVREYIRDLQGRMSTTKAKITFAKPNPAPAMLAEAKPAKTKKHLNVNVITGSYKRVDSDQKFEAAELKVLRMSGNKISFSCQAIDGAHTGEASGVVPIKDNIAVFKQDEGNDMTYKLIMHFDGKFVHIAQVGDGFGGIGVTATGTYEKTDDHKPQILQN